MSDRSVAQKPAIVERDEELTRIDGAVAAAIAGSGSVLLIEGPAGIGKSRLLAEARVRAAAAGMQMFGARGGAFERDLAYGAVRLLFERELLRLPDGEREALLAGAAALARPALTTAEQDGPVPPDRSSAVLHGLYWLVANLAERGPLLLAVDDVHWFDAPSLRFLLYLARRIEDLPVLVVACARQGEEGPEPLLVEELLAPPGAVVLRPRPLSRAGVAAVLRERTARIDVAPQFSDACHEVAGGNPFLVGELAGALLAGGVVPDAGAAAKVRDVRPRTLSRSVLLRVSRMPTGAAALAVAVAVLGEDVALHDARLLADVDEEPAVRALDRLAAAEILMAEQPLRFVHPLVREAIYGDLGPAERARWHARAAQLMQGRAAGSGRVASHLLHTPPRGSAETVTSLSAAARAALGRGGPEIAARYLRRAVAEPPGPDTLAGILLQLAEAMFLTGDKLTEVPAHLRAAIAHTPDASARVRAWLLLSRSWVMHGDVPAAAAALEEGISNVGDERLAAPLEDELGPIGLTHPDTAEQAAARIARLTVPEGDGPRQRRVLASIAALAGYEGRPSAEVAELCRRALGGDRLVADGVVDSTSVYQTIWLLASADRVDEARTAAGLVIADGRARGSVWATATGLELRAFVADRSGNIADSEADMREATSVPGLSPVARPSMCARHALALVERGALDEADAELARAGTGPDLPENAHMNLAFFARGILRSAQGRTADALEDMCEYGARCGRVLLRNPVYPWRAEAALALAALGEAEEAQRLADEHDLLAQRWGTASAIGISLRVRGMLAGGEAGIALLREAAAADAASPVRHEHARTLAELGSALRRAGKRAEACELLTRAVELARSCGALAIAERAHAELAVAGGRPRRLQFSGVEALTPSERRVAQLAADGLSNRAIAQSLFVTAKTVENHLGRAYIKLGISSRAQLGELLAVPPGAI